MTPCSSLQIMCVIIHQNHDTETAHHYRQNASCHTPKHDTLFITTDNKCHDKLKHHTLFITTDNKCHDIPKHDIQKHDTLFITADDMGHDTPKHYYRHTICNYKSHVPPKTKNMNLFITTDFSTCVIIQNFNHFWLAFQNKHGLNPV